MLFYDEKVPSHFWSFTTVTGVLPSKDSDIKGPIVRIKKANQSLNVPQINSSELNIHIMAVTKQIKQGNTS